MEPFVLPVEIQKFISMIRSKPDIWNVNKNKFGRQESWLQILNEIYPDFSTWDVKERLEYFKKVVKKWTQIRDSYVKSERKKLFMTEAERGRYRSYIHSEHLAFLKPVLSSIKGNRTDQSQKSDTTDSEDDTDCELESSLTLDKLAQIKVKDIPNEPLEHVNLPRKRSYSHSSDDSPIVKVRAIEPSTSTLIDGAETHMSFFRGIIPSLECFDVDQVLEFQIGVLKLVKQIRSRV